MFIIVCFLLYDKQSGRIGADEEIDDNKGKSVEEIEEQLAEKEAKTRAVLLEMVKITYPPNAYSKRFNIQSITLSSCNFLKWL